MPYLQSKTSSVSSSTLTTTTTTPCMTQLLPHSSHIALLWLPQIYSHLPHSRGRSPTKARLCFPHGNLGFSHVAARFFFFSPHKLTATANNTDTSCDGRSNCDITVEPSGTKLKKEGSRKSVELTLKRQMCHFFIQAFLRTRLL